MVAGSGAAGSSPFEVGRATASAPRSRHAVAGLATAPLRSPRDQRGLYHPDVDPEPSRLREVLVRRQQRHLQGVGEDKIGGVIDREVVP